VSTATKYLVLAKIEEVASKLRADGYDVTVPDDPFDLVAAKAGKKVALEVIARAELRDEAKSIQKLRERARSAGFDEFRLVVVAPPKQTSVTIQGFEQQLSDHLVSNLPPELDALSTGTVVLDVTDTELDSVEVAPEGVRVSGMGVVEVELNYGGGAQRDGLSQHTDFPIDFDVRLTPDLRIEQVDRVEVDTSSFYE